MISTNEHIAGNVTALGDLEKLTASFAHDREQVCAIVANMEEELAAVRRRYLGKLRTAVAKAQTSRTLLFTAVEAHPELFERPKTQVFHGIKIGFRKGTGGIDWDDDAKVCELIRKHFPKAQAELLIKTSEKPIAKAIADLDVADLKRIGCRVESTGDVVVVKPMDSEVEKVVTALLSEEAEVAS